MLPKVSILIPCFNSEKWIAEAISSALNQTYCNKEIIVIDDGSTDRSLDIIKGFEGSIRWETGPNRGGNITRNRLLELSTGSWLQYLDADDCLLPDKTKRQIDFLNQNLGTDVVYSPSIYEYVELDKSRREIVPIPQPHDPWILLARWYLPQTGSPLWKKQAIIDAGGWKPQQPCCQEHELYLRLLKAGKKFGYCSYAGSIYRQWSENTVCKRDKPEVLRQRLKIEDSIEAYLTSIGELTIERRNAINQARFECARLIWLSDRNWATEVIEQIKASDQGFLPSGDSAPRFYQMLYKGIGFSNAENIASLKRRLSNLTYIRR